MSLLGRLGQCGLKWWVLALWGTAAQFPYGNSRTGSTLQCTGMIARDYLQTLLVHRQGSGCSQVWLSLAQDQGLELRACRWQGMFWAAGDHCLQTDAVKMPRLGLQVKMVFMLWKPRFQIHCNVRLNISKGTLATFNRKQHSQRWQLKL